MLTQKKIADDWQKRGFCCSLWTDSPGQCWEDFKHEVDELVLVLNGEVEFEISGKLSHPQPGEELLIPAKANHSVRNIGNTVANWLYGYRKI